MRLVSGSRFLDVSIEQATELRREGRAGGVGVANAVALIPECVECGGRWLPADEERWQAWLTCDEPPELAFYCPTCGNREFKATPDA